MIRVAALAIGLAAAGTSVAAQCRQALALGLDVSGSVDAREYRQQVGGIAAALASKEVRRKLMAMPSAPMCVFRRITAKFQWWISSMWVAGAEFAMSPTFWAAR